MKPSVLQAAFLCLTLSAAMAFPASGAEPHNLQKGAPLERSLGGSESHAYAVRAASGQLLKIVVDQRGVDAVVRLLSPAGKLLKEVDGPTGDQVPERLEWITAEAGVYQVRVSPLEASAAPGKYEIQLAELRPATPREREAARTEETLRAQVVAWHQAFNDADVDAIRRLAAEDFAGGLGDGSDVSREALITMLQQANTTAQATALIRKRRVENLHIHSHRDTAMVRGRAIDTARRGERAVESRVYFSQLWRKQDGRWLLALEQIYPGGPVPKVQRVIPLPKEVLQAYAGRYENEIGTVILLEAAGDHLAYQIASQQDVPPRKLYPTSEVEYYSRDGNFSLTFVRNLKGELSHVIRVNRGQVMRLTPVR